MVDEDYFQLGLAFSCWPQSRLWLILACWFLLKPNLFLTFSLKLSVAPSKFTEDWRRLTRWALVLRAAPSELEFEAHERHLFRLVQPSKRCRRLAETVCFVYLCNHWYYAWAFCKLDSLVEHFLYHKHEMPAFQSMLWKMNQPTIWWSRWNHWFSFWVPFPERLVASTFSLL